MSLPATFNIDVESIIDRSSVSRFQRRVLLLCFGVLILDGIDVNISSYLGPALVTHWHITKAAYGPVLTGGLVGLAVGSLTAGPLGDRVGRRRVIAFSLGFYAVMSALSTLSTGIDSLTVMRLLTGLGLGASMPNAATLVAEYAPRARRGVMMTFMYCGFTIGAAVSGYLTNYVVHAGSWQWALLVGAILPLLYLPVIARRLPESPKFLARQGGHERELTEIVEAIDPGCTLRARSDADRTAPVVSFTVTEPNAADTSPRVLVSRRYSARTLTIWLGFFAAFFTVYLMNGWLPLLMTSVGFSAFDVSTIGFMLQAGGTVGNILIGHAMDRYGMHRAIAVSTLCAGVMLVAISAAPRSVLVVGALIFVLGAFTNSLAVAYPVLAATSYPTALRATGTSWATGIARLGAIAGTSVGTALVAAGFTYRGVFLVLLAPVAVGVLAVSLKSRLAGGDPHEGLAHAHPRTAADQPGRA
jgi:AAHS family 4-hydroxybenzoate transporter-like MFS transporter